MHKKYKYAFPFLEGGMNDFGVTDGQGAYNLKTIPGDYAIFVWKESDPTGRGYIASLDPVKLDELNKL